VQKLIILKLTGPQLTHKSILIHLKTLWIILRNELKKDQGKQYKILKRKEKAT